MQDLLIAIEQRSFPQLVSDCADGESFQSWLSKGEFTLDSQSTDEKIMLIGASYRNLARFLGADFSRFAFSSIESFQETLRPRPAAKAISWRMIALYYSAYYAAQAISRSVGPFMVRLDGKIPSYLGEIANLINISAKPTKGHYKVALDVQPYDTVNVTLEKLSEKQDGGAHDAFWLMFDRFLSSVAEYSVTNKLSNASDIVADINTLQKLLRARGSSRGGFLSVVRNEISYRHEYGGWFPYDLSAKEIDDVNRLAWGSSSAIRTDLDPNKYPLRSFVSTAQILSNMCLEVGTKLADATGAGTFKRRLIRLQTIN